MNFVTNILPSETKFSKDLFHIREEFPLLFVETNDRLNALHKVVREEKLVQQKKMSIDGYFQQDSGVIQFKLEIASLAALVDRLNILGLPPVVLFYTDFAWLIFYSLNDLLTDALGDDFMFLPDFWAWHVDPQKGQAGWTPHRDRSKNALFADGSIKSVTCWIPLTEADPLNGCMYIVPKQHDLSYGVEGAKINLKNGLPSIRALPAKPGDVLVWCQEVLHWGAQSSEFSKKPRMSIALEAQSGKADPLNLPLINPNELLSETSRLKLIGKQMLQYKHMHSLSTQQEQFALYLINQ